MAAGRPVCPLAECDRDRGALQWFLALGGTLHFTPVHWIVAGDLALSSVAFHMEGGHDPGGNPVPLQCELPNYLA